MFPFLGGNCKYYGLQTLVAARLVIAIRSHVVVAMLVNSRKTIRNHD
jgi:hypothetical protein